jgi:hypothetical protein
METNKPVTISATVFWANLAAKNEMSGKYQVDLGLLSDAAVEALQKQGLQVRNKPDDEKGNYITVKSTNPMKAYNTSGDEIGCLVGNGSKAKAVLGHYDWQFQGKKGRSPSCLKLVITELNEYAPEGSIDVALEEAL